MPPFNPSPPPPHVETLKNEIETRTEEGIKSWNELLAIINLYLPDFINNSDTDFPA